jgi:hypothetical protein
MPACRLPGMLKPGHNHMTGPISYFVYDVFGFEDEGKRKKKKEKRKNCRALAPNSNFSWSHSALPAKFNIRIGASDPVPESLSTLLHILFAGSC